MAMTDDQHHAPPARWEPDDLDGHSIEELSDYLDAGRRPEDFSIESSPGCQIALAALERLRMVSGGMLQAQALSEPEPEESWISGIVHNISREARAGRTIPFAHPDAIAELGITEGSVRGLIRAAADTVAGIVIGRCGLEGDVTVPGTPITVTVDATADYGASIPETTARLREAIHLALARHTELVVDGIDITIHDIHVPTRGGAPS
jgi:uncharacterized alkaline shock family protein YloU